MNLSIRAACTWVLVAVFCLLLSACFGPTAPPSHDFEPFESSTAGNASQCPDLSGTYRLVYGSEESKLFSPYLLPAHDMDMVQLKRSSNDWFEYRLKMDETRFAAQVSALRISNPNAYAAWRELIARWQQQKREKKELSVLEDKILQIGPLPERGGLITPTQCKDHWGMVKYQDGHPVGLEDTDQDVGTIETSIFLTRGKSGDLVFRYDNATTSSFLFGSRIRTGISNSAYAKLEPIQHSLFDWELTEKTAPRATDVSEPTATSRMPVENGQQVYQAASPNFPADGQSADLSGVMVDVQQYAISHLPTGADITYFKPENESGNARWISMKGEAKSNKDVSDLLRAMMTHAELENVELVSIQAKEQSRIAFDIRLKLKKRVQ